MNPLSIFKLPLAFAGSHRFHQEFKKLNKNVSDESISDDYFIKYRFLIKEINRNESEVIISLQEDPTIVIYKFKDKLVLLPKLEEELLIERTIMSKSNEVYIIDGLTHQLLLIKKFNVNNKPKGFLKPMSHGSKTSMEDLYKFITFDLESITNLDSLKNEGDKVLFEPVVLSSYDFYERQGTSVQLKKYKDIVENIPAKSNEPSFPRDEKIKIIQEHFIQYLNKKYHKYVLYAHNFSSFDGILIFESLVKMCEEYDYKLDPLIKDNKIISVKMRFGRVSGTKYRYYIEFHDSLLLLLSSLEKLSKTFLKDNPELQKMNNKALLKLLLNENYRNELSELEFYDRITSYCERDTVSLAFIIFTFAHLIYNRYQLNIHKYPTLPSLAFAIFKSKYMKTKIQQIQGEVNQFIRNSYTGGHVDAYKLYSNKLTYMYDFISLYPTVMSKFKLPIRLINHFKGNPLDANYSIDYLNSDELASFIKCDIFVDSSINRPVFQTRINNKTMCATGLFKNQHVFLPEMLEYSRLTNNKIRIIDGSITEGYIFKCENIFYDYINSLFEIKKSVNKNDPMYLISKILMNSLYGRFGLKPALSQFSMVDTHLIDTFILENKLHVSDIIEMIDSNKSFIVSNKVIDTLDINVAISSAITAYARTIMAPLLLDESIPVLYTDTDSFVTEIDLSLTKYKHVIHNNLGGLKLENIFKEFIAISPKVYGGILLNDSKIIKVKGFKNKIEFETFKDLLFNNKNIILNQSKWFKSFKNGSINIKNNPYTLSMNENKRIIDFNSLTTKPYHIIP
uniref:DNA polymerase n=1 Tax=Amanita pseudoporphyria TaxID=67725 RepID=A0A5Q0N1Y7_9AGAR|nr:DNA polymerase type B [Amanita pseudoporphyria]QFZ98516.1 DNA polymerase type B [Amanita pseudoporphyria]